MVCAWDILSSNKCSDKDKCINFQAYFCAIRHGNYSLLWLNSRKENETRNQYKFQLEYNEVRNIIVYKVLQIESSRKPQMKVWEMYQCIRKRLIEGNTAICCNFCWKINSIWCKAIYVIMMILNKGELRE